MNEGKGARTALSPSFGYARERIARTGLSALRRGWGMSIGLMVCWGFVLGGQWAGRAAEVAEPGVTYRSFAMRIYSEEQVRYRKDPTNAEAAWQFARACFEAGEFATNSAERSTIAEQGIAASRQVLARDRNSAAGHYYLGINLGQLARTRGLSALKLVDQMEYEFSLARDLDETIDYGGPDRNLGILYYEAPSFASIGSRSKARQHFQRAAELAPDYPENQLNLIEAYLKWHEHNGAVRHLKILEERWASARAKLAGPSWAANWADWKLRLQSAQKKIEEPSKALESPRGKE